MRKYKVFIDTCAYYKEQFQFDKTKSLVMALLKNEIDLGNIEILLPVITLNEIKKNLLCDVEEYNIQIKNAIQKVFKDKPWFNNEISNYQILIDNNRLDDFTKFIKDYHCKILNYDLINSTIVQRVFEKYFKNQFPFENNKYKKCEFPDAFVIEILKTFDPTELIIVSEDNGFINSFDKDKVLIFDDIKSLLNYLISKNPKSKNAFYHLSIIMDKYKETMIKIVNDKVKNYNVVIPHVDVLTVNCVKSFGQPYDAKIIDFDEKYLTFSVSIVIDVEFEYLNDEQEAELKSCGEVADFIFKAELLGKKDYKLEVIKDDMFDCFFIDKL